MRLKLPTSPFTSRRKAQLQTSSSGPATSIFQAAGTLSATVESDGASSCNHTCCCFLACCRSRRSRSRAPPRGLGRFLRGGRPPSPCGAVSADTAGCGTGSTSGASPMLKEGPVSLASLNCQSNGFQSEKYKSSGVPDQVQATIAQADLRLMQGFQSSNNSLATRRDENAHATMSAAFGVSEVAFRDTTDAALPEPVCDLDAFLSLTLLA